MVVVPTCAPEWISRSLDSGAQAIIVPHVNDVVQAKMCVDAAKFPPMVSEVEVASTTSRRCVHLGVVFISALCSSRRRVHPFQDLINVYLISQASYP
jgi:2-keto-3-deoxy-L-rhamnonate aldolase RhmA